MLIDKQLRSSKTQNCVQTFRLRIVYEKSQDLTPSILPAKSESIHQCEMNNKVERLRWDYPLSFFSMQMLETRPAVYKKTFQYRFEMN